MVEKGFKVTHEKKGKPLCCFAISTIILLIALGAVAFVYRETLIEKFNNITSESSGSESSGSEYVDNNSDDLELTTLNFYDMEDVTEDSRENMTLTIEETTESFSDTSDKISDTTRPQVWENIFKTPSTISTTTTESPETTKDSVISGSGDDSNYKKSKTNANDKVISYDDEDYIEGST